MSLQNLKTASLSLPYMVTGASNSVGLLSGTAGSYVKGYSIQLGISVNTPAAATFTAVAATDLLTSAAHGFVNGLKGQTSNSGGGLPAGLAASTDYFVIVVSANTYKLATSYANAIAGTAIDITSAGTGTQTFTPTAIAGASYKVQVSSDGINWVDLAAATNITASTTVLVEKLDPMYDFIQLVYLITAGSMSIVQNVMVKGEAI